MNIKGFLKTGVVFFIIWTWVYVGHPRIWPIGNYEEGRIRIPPKVEKAEALSVSSGDGLIIYGQGGSGTHWRTYTNSSNSFSASSTLDFGGGSNKAHIVRTSPTKQEAIAVFATTTAQNIIRVDCYNGTTWSNEWATTSVAASNYIPFDVAYEASSGDVMVLYATAAGTTNELEYRTKSGSTGCGIANWSAPEKLDPVRTSGVVDWVKLNADRRTTSTLIAATWQDANADLSSMIWNGSSWGNEPTTALETSLEIVILGADVDPFKAEYESGSGDLMVVWGSRGGSNGTNGAYYATCTGGTSTCTWSSTSTIASLLDDATHLDIAANKNSDEIVFASLGAGSDLQVAYWSGSSWTGTPNLDITTQKPAAAKKWVSVGWLISGATTRSIIVYNDTTPNTTSTAWAVGNESTFATGTPFKQSPLFNIPYGWMDIQVDPINKDRLMLSLSEGGILLYAKRLVMDSTPTFTWTNADGAASLATLDTNTLSSHSFAYWAFISTISTVSCSTNISATAFGALDSGTISTSSPNASTTMTCDGASGCTLYVSDSGGGGNPGLWNSTSSALIESPNAAFSATATLVAGTEGYGIQGATTTVGSDGVLNIAARYLQTGNVVGGFLTSNTVLASSTAAVTNREIVVTHKAVVGAETPSGTYDDTITYNCVLN